MQKKKLILAIVPLLYAIIVLAWRSQFQFIYNYTFDPSYAYLFNGLNLAQGKLTLGHVDHPGTPVQILIAIIIRIVYTFRNSSDLIEDVISNPETYLYYISHVFVILNTFALYILGYFTLRVSSNLSGSFLIQCTPFVSKYLILFSPFIMVEPVLLLTGILILSQLVYLVYRPIEQKSYLRLIAISILIGFGVACKINFAPILLLPLFIFKGVIRKILSLTIAALTFILSAALALKQGDYFINWTTKLITKSGKYGSGAETFIDMKEFYQNLKNILEERFLLVVFLIIATIYILRIIIRKKPFSIHERILSGIVSLGAIQLFIVSKHFSLHYLIPLEIFLIFGIIVFIAAIRKTSNSKTRITSKTISIIKVAAGIILIIHSILTLNLFRTKAAHETKYSQVPSNTAELFVIPIGGALPNVEAALYFGQIYAGKQKNNYAEKLQLLYPNTFFFIEKTKEYYNWSGKVRAKDILSTSDTVIVRFRNSKEFPASSWTQNLSTSFNWDTVCTNQIQFFDSDGSYHICTSIRDKSNSLFKVENLIYSIDSSYFDRVQNYSQSIIDSSLKLSSNSTIKKDSIVENQGLKMGFNKPYAIGIKIPVTTNAFYKMSVWQRQSEYNGILVATSRQRPEFYVSGEVVSERSDDWQKITLNFAAPAFSPKDSLFLYLWYPHQGDAYFDDFRLEVWK